jgi:hypothetical protein
MARILFDQGTLEVSESTEEVLQFVVKSRDGLRSADGKIIAPAGWVVLTEADGGAPAYVQVGRIGAIGE